jgi:hypothetical protein
VGKTEGANSVPESRAPFHAALKRPEASEDNDTEDPSFKSLWRNSVCQVAQRSRGGGEGPRQARRARLKKSTISCQVG